MIPALTTTTTISNPTSPKHEVIRKYQTFPLDHPTEFKWQMLNWASRFNICAFLDSHSYTGGQRNCLLAAGAFHIFSSSTNGDINLFPDGGFTPAPDADTFSQLTDWKRSYADWAFGHFSFNLSEETEKVPQHPQKHTRFGNAFFFVPDVLLEITPDGSLRIGSIASTPESIWEEISRHPVHNSAPLSMYPFQPRLTRSEYIEKIKSLQAHILRGDCYEINFCQEFFTYPRNFDPVTAYRQLSSASPAPFGGFYKIEDHFVLCASPERYLQKQGQVVRSQPIKGTWERDPADPVKDLENRRLLQESPKERAENIMIVDLVRNDLSRVCEEGSVEVEELCGIYSFPQVHQMVSTIRGVLPSALPWTEAIRHTFPMGSMTGAPKKRVMELIYAHEPTARGIYSGAIGYVSPEDDFDFNVVIRSLVYNASANYLSYHVGSGITGYCDAAQEYEECLLKAEGIRKAMGENATF